MAVSRDANCQLRNMTSLLFNQVIFVDGILSVTFAQPEKIVCAYHVSHLGLHGGWGDDGALQPS